MKQLANNDNSESIKSIGGFNSKFFFVESSIILIAIIFYNKNESLLNILIWFLASAIVIVIFSSRWLNGIDFYEKKVVLINRQFFIRNIFELEYNQIKKVVFKNFSYTSPSYLKIEYEFKNELKNIKIPYDYYRDKGVVVELLKKNNIPLEVRGYQI